MLAENSFSTSYPYHVLMLVMDAIERAFENVRRKDFVPYFLRHQAEIDMPLPIGHEQTISQPTTVRRMLYWLDTQPGDKVLDIGSGSGWTSALLLQLVGPTGKVYAVEKIPELLKFGQDNCEKLGIHNIQFFLAGQDYGLPEYSPYDRILVSASAKKLPEVLLDQLTVGGKLVIPVNNDILEITKTSDTDRTTQTHPGYVFVPLV